MRTLRLLFLCLGAAGVILARASLADAAASEAPAAAPAPVAAPLAQDQFLGLVAHELSAHFNLEGELSLDLVRPWETPDRVARTWKVRLAEFPSIPSASMLVQCRIMADGTMVADYPLVLRAALWRDAWACRQPAEFGSTFDPGYLEVRRVDLFRDRDAVPASVGDRTFIFARSITAGRLLTWHDIARRPLVRKGDLVEVSAADGMLSITMKGLAMQNGSQGEAVMVRNLDSKKEFTAFVVDENHVQVRF